MSTVSYAQNHEDVMLARVFADIPHGFYVDVGAQDPVVDSVTKVFYDRGWRGINIEPVTQWFERLQKERPRDLNLNVAAGREAGTLLLHEFADSGLSTSSAAFARDHAAAGRPMIDHVVPVASLDSILDEHAPGELHFLKIDVEGMESEVLGGISLRRHRPWVLVIEATQPNTPLDLSAAWEPAVLETGYRLVYRDGLNRFYLAEEKLDRASFFAVPPNVFDDFIPYREHRGNEYARSLESRLDAAHTRAEQLGRNLSDVTQTAERYRVDLLQVTKTAEERGRRMQELDATLRSTAETAERYRVDLLQVAKTADERGRRMQELDTALQSTAKTAERYRVDLLQVAKTAEDQQQRLQEQESLLRERQRALETKAAEGERYRLQLQAVAIAAENRRALIVELEGRLSQSEQQLWDARRTLVVALADRELLQAELDRVHGSRSWRMTAPLRAVGRSARQARQRLLRSAAAVGVLRALGSRLLPRPVRQRVLLWAGYGQPEMSAPPPADMAAQPPSALAELTHAGARIHRLIDVVASNRPTDGVQ